MVATTIGRIAVVAGIGLGVAPVAVHAFLPASAGAVTASGIYKQGPTPAQCNEGTVMPGSTGTVFTCINGQWQYSHLPQPNSTNPYSGN